MAELEIDQSNLPRVREVCQCFAVLEDGALAHNLQEQEIEQYYTTNIQKNQLVQNDIRVAKRLQDEEEEQGAQQRAILRQASRQLEEQDFEYARVIQEELQQCAEEARRRELDDEEIAKRLQEEEEQLIRSKNRRSHCEEGAGDSAVPSTHQHALSRPNEDGEQCLPATTRWQHSTSHNRSDQTRTRRAASLRGVGAQGSTTSWSNQGHADSIRQIREELRAALSEDSEDSEDSDTAFSEQLAAWSRRVNKRVNTAPPQRRASLRYPQERNYRSLHSRSSFTQEFRGCNEQSGESEDYYDDGCSDREKRRLRSQRQESSHTEDSERWHRSKDEDRGSRFVEERRCSRSESVGSHDRGQRGNRDLARTWSCRDNVDKRVHFQDDGRNSNGRRVDSRQVWEMLGQVLRERGVPVTLGANGVPLQIGPQSRDSQVLHGSEVSCGSSQPHQRAFQRSAAARHSFHGDIRKRRRSSHRENSGRDHRDEGDARCDNAQGDSEVPEISDRDSDLARGERRGSRRWRRHGYAENDDGVEERERNASDHGVKRSTSQRRPWHATNEERLRSEEGQEAERRVEWPPRRAPQRSQSLCSSSSSSRAANRERWRHVEAGVSPQPCPGETSLDLGELQQVLRDEELARNLQDEEEKLMRRKSQPPVRGFYPQGDFRVAQVAQDEEIARFMQKQEIKTKRRSRELEGPASWREHRAMISHHDRRATRERQVPRERLDSEGLPSPTEDCFPENQPPSPTSTLPPAQHIKNIAEELDPTFQARRQETELPLVDQRGPDSPSAPLPHSGLNDFLVEPAFVPPTKRQPEKSARAKPKEKKENCKQQ